MEQILKNWVCKIICHWITVATGVFRDLNCWYNGLHLKKYMVIVGMFLIGRTRSGRRYQSPALYFQHWAESREFQFSAVQMWATNWWRFHILASLTQIVLSYLENTLNVIWKDMRRCNTICQSWKLSQAGSVFQQIKYHKNKVPFRNTQLPEAFTETLLFAGYTGDVLWRQT